MPMVTAEKIWVNGGFVPWEDARIHVLSHALHYGTSFFEGARCYKTKRGPACFRIVDHVRRLVDSMKVYRTESPYPVDELVEAILKTIRVNGLDECYIRPIVFRGYGELGVNPSSCPLETVIAVWGWGAYLGAEALEKGVNVCVSSWNRLAPNTLPNMAKVGGNYMNSQLIKMDALANGFDEGIGLDTGGMVSEGSGENIFLVRDGII
ncbi:MAG: branched-chain amino acid transaminase, partial [Candidatus Latescibacteria bacterium]|nr:branched-chain amino acid transaminase [Candidatus Latescibacterota bacterium]